MYQLWLTMHLKYEENIVNLLTTCLSEILILNHSTSLLVKKRTVLIVDRNIPEISMKLTLGKIREGYNNLEELWKELKTMQDICYSIQETPLIFNIQQNYKRH